MSRWLRSLRGRITLVTVAVAVLAVLVTGAVSVQLVRQATLQQARVQLAAQVETLSQSNDGLTLQQLREQVRLTAGHTTVGIVRSNGTVSGGATRLLTAANLRKLATTGSLSLTRDAKQGTVLIEARQAVSGGAVVLARPVAAVDAETRASVSLMGFALLLGVVVAAVAGALLSRWLSKPLVAAARVARRLAAGERGLRIESHSPSEVADVADALATLDVALATSERRQREFLLSISHELRTPLTAVRGYAEALADGLIVTEELATVGKTMVIETERLDQFVADLLELARLEADDFSINHEDVDLTELLTDVQNAWLARSSQLGVRIEVQSDGGSVVTDPRRLRQVIDGLIENGLRAAPIGSSLLLSASRDRTDATIQVRDAGPGLSENDLAVAFERGVLRDRYRDIRPVGTGLGLSIASRLTSRLGGTISMSAAPEGGTVVTVVLGTA